MKKLLNIMYYAGAITLLLGAASRIALPQIYCYIYMVGAVLFALAQFFLRPDFKGLTLRRLVWQQQLAGLFFIAAGVLMFTNVRNEWIVVLSCGAIIELYTSFRISHELKKQERS